MKKLLFAVPFLAIILLLAFSAMKVRNLELRKEALKHLGIAFYKHVEHDQESYYARYVTDSNGTRLLSWRVALSQVHDSTTTKKLNFQESWDSKSNREISETSTLFWSQDATKPGLTRFLAVLPTARLSEQEPFHRIMEMECSQVPAGMRILALEVGPDKAVPWTKPVDFQFNPKDPFAGLGTLENGTFLALMYDGSVQEFNTDELSKQEFLDLCSGFPKPFQAKGFF